MKHTNFNMPTLRRITLFAILLLGTMPMWAEAYTGNLYLIGGDCVGLGWNQNNAVQLTNEGNGIYTLTYSIAAVPQYDKDGFKFLEGKSWDVQWRPTYTYAKDKLEDNSYGQRLNPGDQNIVIAKTGDDTKWQMTESGTYDIRIDLSDKDNGKMSITKSSRYIPIGTFYINGEGFPDMAWNDGNQYKMQWDPAKKLWYYYFANLGANTTYALKLTRGVWGWELNYLNRDESKSNITIFRNNDQDNRFQFSFDSGTHSATIYTDGEKMWAVADEYANGTFNLSGWNLGRSDHDWKTNGRNMIPLSDGTHVFQQYGVDANTTITFKVNYCGTWDNELNYNHIDNSRSDITLQDSKDQNRIKIVSPNYKSDIYFYTDGSKIWVKVYQNGEIPTPACANCEYLGE